MNYGFYISGTSMRLYKFLSSTSKKNVKSIKIVVSDKKIPTMLLELLDSYAIKYVVVDRSILGKNNIERNLNFSDILLEYLSKYDVDYMFSFGEHLLTGKLLEAYRWRLINFHPSILPMYSGFKAIDQANAHGNTLIVGNTAHFIDESVDGGPIIMQYVIPIKAFRDAGNDYDQILDLIIPMLNMLMSLLEDGRISVKNNLVEIQGADYGHAFLFPYIGEQLV